jgi:aspartate 1-decarboxylase
MVDIGFSPETNLSNRLEDAKVLLEYFNQKNEVEQVSENILEQRNHCSSRVMLSSLICGLEVTATHPDCLQGSAELPEDIMTVAGLNRYRGVFVYNADKGGMAETYAVPMPPGIVMTTGAMAGFAPIGTETNIAAYNLSKSEFPLTIVNVRNNSSKELEIIINHS